MPKKKYCSKSLTAVFIITTFFASQFKICIITYYSYIVTKVFKNWTGGGVEMKLHFLKKLQHLQVPQKMPRLD